MIDPDICVHGRPLFSECIFCGGTAKKPPAKGSPVVKPRELAPATPGARPPVKEAAHRPPDTPRKGPPAKKTSQAAAAKEAIRAADAELLEQHQDRLAEEQAAALAAQAERLHKGDTVPPAAPPQPAQRIGVLVLDQGTPEVGPFPLTIDVGSVAAGHLKALVRTGYFGATLEAAAESMLLAGLRQNAELLTK